MYLNYLVDIPDIKGKITYRNKGNARYVYFECDRVYDPLKKYTNVRRVTIGKVSDEDETKMRPNQNFKKYFPEVEVPEEERNSIRSSCLQAGAYMVIQKSVKDLELDKILDGIFDSKTMGFILDFAAYSIITEGNAAQYYPDYAYNHPLFTPGMKIYNDSAISDFLRTINHDQRQSFLDAWNEERSKRERIYISYDSTNKNCEAGDISMVEFGTAKVDTGLPIFNYAVGYDVNNREPLMYEKYSGSINDISQLQYMVEKIKGYGYRNIGFILDRGYFSKDNLHYMDSNGFSFIIMVKGCRELVSSLIRKHRGSFESDWGNQISDLAYMANLCIAMYIPQIHANAMFTSITVRQKLSVNVFVWRNVFRRCKTIWRDIRILIVSLGQHLRSTFTCITTRKPATLYTENQSCRKYGMNCSCVATLQLFHQRK